MNPPMGMPGTLSVEQVADDDVLDEAYAWFCARRKRFPDACDIWAFRRRWSAAGLLPLRLPADRVHRPLLALLRLGAAAPRGGHVPEPVRDQGLIQGE
jgi:hypothetical protein